MSFSDKFDIDQACDRLQRQMLYHYVSPISLVVCGGTALHALNLANRTTDDVDVLVVVEESGTSIHLKYGESLPEDFRQLIAKVGRDLGHEADWMNMGPRDVLITYGAPQGMTERWVKRVYGESLTIYFIGRLDQIHFKLLAAADPTANPRHMEDLRRRLQPTKEEIRLAVDWLLDRETSSDFRNKVRAAVEEVGYGDIASTIPK